MVAACLDAMGPLEVSEVTRGELMLHAEKCGDLSWNTREELGAAFRNVSRIMTLIAASRDYQFA